ncbi:MAG: oligosaccharide flippase family protein [Ginsengibacter sp.]
MKATSVFGGVQVFNILISITRAKILAILLGPIGIGIANLLTSTTDFIGYSTEFGLGTSAVRNVAAANSTGLQRRISVVVTVLRRLVWVTGILGTIVTIVLSRWLSQITFGNKNYTIAFIWVSVTLLFTQLNKGQLVLLQGMRRIQYMAKASVTGNFLGLLITIPLYYKFGIDAIVPSIIITSFIALAFSWFYSKKIQIEPARVSIIRTYAEGKDMLVMGFLISLSGIITLGISYFVRIYISSVGGVAEVGLYAAGFALINTYVGLIFTAMTNDYYPRLSAVAHDNNLSRRTINEQAEIALLILAPVIAVFLVFSKPVVIILYSEKFIPINGLIHWAALGILFKSTSWAVGYLFMAKGDSKLFFKNEMIASVYIFGLNIAGYRFFGLTGLGISFFSGYVIYLIQVYMITHKRYQFSFDKSFIKIFCIQLLLVSMCFSGMIFLRNPYTAIFGVFLILISGAYSVYELNERLDIIQFFKRVKNRF